MDATAMQQEAHKIVVRHHRVKHELWKINQRIDSLPVSLKAFEQTFCIKKASLCVSELIWQSDEKSTPFDPIAVKSTNYASAWPTQPM